MTFDLAVLENTIAARIHGRYLVLPPATGDAKLVLAGFHGYAESAETQMERLRRVGGSDRCVTVSIQGLNRFYERRTDSVIAGWMTRQDRELAIADNIAYVESVLEAVSREFSPRLPVLFTGFSQGVAMAFRAGAAARRAVAGVVAVGGDIPPELDEAQLRTVRAALICRGARDTWYTADIFRRDFDRLTSANVPVSQFEASGGHEWSSEISDAVSRFLLTRFP